MSSAAGLDAGADDCIVESETNDELRVWSDALFAIPFLCAHINYGSVLWKRAKRHESLWSSRDQGAAVEAQVAAACNPSRSLCSVPCPSRSCSWYDANAAHVWGGTGPTWDETKKHRFVVQ